MRLVRPVSFAGKIRDLSACFFNDQKPRRTIPGLQLVFIKSVEPPGRYPAEIHGRRPQPAHGDATPDQSGEYFQRAIGMIEISIRETRHQTGTADFRFGAYLYLLVVERGAISCLREIEFIDKRIINGAQDHLAILLQADRYATDRDAMCKIHRTIDRVDDPLIV